METIKMANGASYSCSYARAVEDTAHIYFNGSDFVAAAQIFGSPNNTRRMEHGDYVLDGYTRLVNLYKQDDCIHVILKKEAL